MLIAFTHNEIDTNVFYFITLIIVPFFFKFSITDSKSYYSNPKAIKQNSKRPTVHIHIHCSLSSQKDL